MNHRKSYAPLAYVLISVWWVIGCGLLSSIGTPAQATPIEPTRGNTSTPTQEPTAEPTVTVVPPTPEPATIIRLGPGKFGKPIWLEVLKGRYQISGGDILLEGSAVAVNEDWLTLAPGLVIEVAAGGVTLQGQNYSEGTTLYVDESGHLSEEPYQPVSSGAPACPFAGDTDQETFSNLIQAEGDAVVNKDLDMVRMVFTEDATIKDVENNLFWTDVIQRYQEAFAAVDFVELTHYDIRFVKQTADQVWATANDRGELIVNSNGERIEYDNNNGQSHYIFGKDENGCWRLVHFSFNASNEVFP